MSEPIVLCWSGGKDSALALYELQRDSRYEVVSLLTTFTRDHDRISMHGVRRELLHRQAAALRLPLDEVWITQGAGNDEYEARMNSTFAACRERGIRQVAFGDIFLEDLRAYRERHLAAVEMQAVFPIWQRDTRALYESYLADGFRAITCCIDTQKLDDGFVGRALDQQFLAELPPGVDPCGENGEFHSFTWAGPIFSEEIGVRIGELVRRDSFLYCDLLPI